MVDRALVNGISEWLVDQALGEPNIVTMFEGLCLRLHSVGIPLGRARLTWPTLHPLFEAETILWKRGRTTEFEQFLYQDTDAGAWQHSPMKYMFDHGLTVLRRHLSGPSRLLDFPVLHEMVEQGYSDYFVVRTMLSHGGTDNSEAMSIIATWCADREDGFTNDELEALQKIQRRFAIACKTAILRRIAFNISETYLGREAGARVLAGSIRRGDGRVTEAVVWFNDLRNSTALADTMPGSDYIELLNQYFDCTATPVIEAGGEVLDFIGDGVLAIFPYQDTAGQQAAVRAAAAALHKVRAARDALNARRAALDLFPIRFGIGINTGSVMFGNIGVPQRLTFSVIGPTVNEVARIEALTKATGEEALVTRDIAAIDPDNWLSIGSHRLSGVAEEIELFAIARDEVRRSAESGGIIELARANRN